MSGAMLAELVLKVGWPMAKEIFNLWSEPVVSPEHIARLDAIAEKKADEYFNGMETAVR